MARWPSDTPTVRWTLNGLVVGTLVLAGYACYRAIAGRVNGTADIGLPLLSVVLFLGALFLRAVVKSAFARRRAAEDRAARVKAFEALAQKESLTYRPEVPFDEAADFLLETGHLRYMTRPGVDAPRTERREDARTRREAYFDTLPVTNFLEGDYLGHRIRLFDYFGRVMGEGGAPGSRLGQSIRETTVAIELSGATLPQFLVAATKRFHIDHCAERAGMSPVQWPGSPTFFHTYNVWAEDHVAVERIFSAGTTRFFELNVHRFGDLAVHGNGSWLFVFEPGRTTNSENLEALAQRAADIAGLFA